MVRRTSLAAGVFAVVLGVVPAAAAPIRLARHPDYHAGRVAFSYLGDIWVANEDGSNVQRLTDNRAREIYPRFSPDGRWIAFSSNGHLNASAGQNMENYGVPPDVYVDNTPADFLEGRDAQIQKAVDVLKAEIAAPRKPASQQ